MINKIATALLCTVAPAALLAQEVDLRSSDEFISVEGEITGFNGVMVSVQTAVGAISVPASEVICYGVGCLEIIQNNDFGLTADAFEGVVVGDATQQGATAEERQVAFAAPVFQTMYRALVGAFIADSGSQTAASVGAERTVSLQNDASSQSATISTTRDPAQADITIQSVSLAGTQPAVFDGPADWIANNGLTHQMIGLKSFSVIVAPNAEINQISMNDLARIYAGEVTNWSEVGGADMPILPLQLPPNSALGGEVNALIMEPAGKEIAGNVLTMGDEAGISASIVQFPGSMSVVTSAGADPSLTVPVSGACDIPVRALPFNIVSGDYPLIRPVMAAYATPPTGDLVVEMFDFATEDGAQAALEAEGFLNHSAISHDVSLKNNRLSGLLNTPLDDVQRATAAQMFEVLLSADRLSPTLTGGAASGPEGAWNRAMLRDVVEVLRDPANTGREIIFVGTGVSDAGSQAAIDLSAAAAADVAAALQSVAPAIIAGGNYTISSYGFGDAAPSSCIDGQVAGSGYSRIEVWIK